MTVNLNAVEFKEKLDGSWQATHTPSGRVTHGLSQEEAEASMIELLGLEKDGSSSEPLTSDLFEGTSREIAVYLEGPVSKMLELHSGFARLEAYSDGLATIRLGGGCQGCPSSRITLMNGVFKDLQDRFGEDVADVQPVLD